MALTAEKDLQKAIEKALRERKKKEFKPTKTGALLRVAGNIFNAPAYTWLGDKVDQYVRKKEKEKEEKEAAEKAAQQGEEKKEKPKKEGPAAGDKLQITILKLLQSMQGDVDFIKQRISPKFFDAKSSQTGEMKRVMYDPLGPAGQQFRRAEEGGKFTSAMGKDLEQSAIGKVTAGVLKQMEGKFEKIESNQEKVAKAAGVDLNDPTTFVDPSEESDPIARLRKEMNTRFDEVIDMLKKLSGKDGKGGIGGNDSLVDDILGGLLGTKLADWLTKLVKGGVAGGIFRAALMGLLRVSLLGAISAGLFGIVDKGLKSARSGGMRRFADILAESTPEESSQILDSAIEEGRLEYADDYNSVIERLLELKNKTEDDEEKKRLQEMVDRLQSAAKASDLELSQETDVGIREGKMRDTGKIRELSKSEYDKYLEEAQDSGLYDWDRFLDSEIDETKLKDAPVEQLFAILQHDDIDAEDKSKVLDAIAQKGAIQPQTQGSRTLTGADAPPPGMGTPEAEMGTGGPSAPTSAGKSTGPSSRGGRRKKPPPPPLTGADLPPFGQGGQTEGTRPPDTDYSTGSGSRGGFRKPTKESDLDEPKAGGGSARQLLQREMDAQQIPQEHRASLLGQVHHESGGFRRLSEDLNYSAARLLEVFPKYYTKESAAEDAHNPEKIANRVYGGRNGNNLEGDGYKYRGRGYIQLTGKYNYEKYGRMIGEDLVSNPDLAAKPEIAAKVAVAYYKDKVVNAGIKPDDTKAITKQIQGGSLGLEERAKLTSMYSEELGAAGTIMASTPPSSTGTVESTPTLPAADTTPAAPPAAGVDRQLVALQPINNNIIGGGNMGSGGSRDASPMGNVRDSEPVTNYTNMIDSQPPVGYA